MMKEGFRGGLIRGIGKERVELEVLWGGHRKGQKRGAWREDMNVYST